MTTKSESFKNFALGALTCQFAVMLFVLGALNIAFWYFQPLSAVDPARLPYLHTWEWWRTQDYLKLKESPDVVLLGSSLIMNPVSSYDADYLKKDFDAVHHPRSVYAEDRVKEAFGIADPVCFNFGLPGGMVSDDYMVARALFARKKPKVVIIGLTLRDFIESHVKCAASTPTFKYFSKFFGVDEIVDQSMPEFWQRFDYWQGKFVYLLGKRLDAQVISSEQLKQLVASYFGKSTAPNPLDQIDLKAEKNVAKKLRSVAEEGEFIMEAGKPDVFEDNSNEYKTRFKGKNEKLYSAENFFLERLLQFTKNEGITTVVVNMPLTVLNMRIMPPGSYERYMKTVKDATAKYDCAFVDLNDFKTFDGVDFHDTAHLNSQGGKKLIDQLVMALGRNEKLVAALKGENVQLSAKEAPAVQ